MSNETQYPGPVSAEWSSRKQSRPGHLHCLSRKWHPPRRQCWNPVQTLMVVGTVNVVLIVSSMTI